MIEIPKKELCELYVYLRSLKRKSEELRANKEQRK